MSDHPHSHDEPGPGSPETPLDANSQALAEALRSSFAIVQFVMVVLVVVFLCSGFFKVDSNERAMILRFGKPVGEGEKALLGPGLHWSFPYPIDEYRKVSISGLQQVKSTVGWYATTAVAEAAGIEMQVPPGTPLNPAVDGYVITADGNIIHSRATLLYRIDDPVRYVFSFVNASNVVQNALDNALVDTAARFTVDQILFSDVTGFREAVRRRVSERLENEKAGVVVEDCPIDSIAPRQLKKAFEDVGNARSARQKALDGARKYANEVLSKAGADANSITNAAETARVQLIAGAASEARRFSDLLPKYEANPSLFIQQRLTETIGRVLANAQDKWVQPIPVPGQSVANWILLNREPPKPKTASSTPP